MKKIKKVKKVVRKKAVARTALFNPKLMKALRTPSLHQAAWDVLTALRSDDTGSISQKEMFTCPLRRWALGRVGWSGGLRYGAWLGNNGVLPTAKELAEMVLPPDAGGIHWRSHIRQAISGAIRIEKAIKNV